MILKVPVVDFLLAVDPEAGQLGQDIDDLEGLEVVDEDVGQPQVMDQLKINWKKDKSQQFSKVYTTYTIRYLSFSFHKLQNTLPFIPLIFVFGEQDLNTSSMIDPVC